jgi:tetratricopeptide (TPR) repeat protein
MRLMAVLVVVMVMALPTFAQQPTDSEGMQQVPIVLAPELIERASSALSAEDYDRALLDYSLFIFLNPTFSQAYFGRSLAYMAQNAAESALEDLDRAIATAPDVPNYRAAVYAARGRLYRIQDRVEEAIADYSESIDLSPSPQTYTDRGILYLQTENYAAALDDMNSAIDLNSEEPVLYYYRAVVQTESQHLPEAAADFYQFLTLIETRSIEGDELQSGRPVVVELNPGIIHRLPFEATAGQTLNAIAGGRRGTSTDPLMILLDPDGEPLIADDDSGGGTTALILQQPLEKEGTYTLIVGHSLGGFTGNVDVQIELQSPE